MQISKHLLVTLFLGVAAWNQLHAIEIQEVEVPSPAYSEASRSSLTPLSGIRSYESGSKFITTYSEDCPEELRGAFEYAVKIWEENLPECLPIGIKVEYGELPDNVPSKVRFQTISFNKSYNSDYLYPTSAVKAVLLREFNHNSYQRFYDEIEDKNILQKDNDIVITYNAGMFGEFSFNLDEEVDPQRFDFVSLALRDIARGLGLAPIFIADTQTKSLERLDIPSTPFTEKIWEMLSDEGNAQIAYINATRGSFNMMFSDIPLSFYAPSEWIDGISLSSFNPDANQPISKLLSKDFGRGVVMRDLSGETWTYVFNKLLDWP